MGIEEILKVKAAETKKMTGLNSKHFAFKNWHATVMQLLRELPSPYIYEVNAFKKLTFEDTRFKRGRKFFSTPDNSRFQNDLDASVKILKDIIKKEKTENKKIDGKKALQKSKKFPKPTAKKSEIKKAIKKSSLRKDTNSKRARKSKKF